jgi:hypothetical protein
MSIVNPNPVEELRVHVMVLEITRGGRGCFPRYRDS